MVRVKIIAMVLTSQYGTLSAGDMLRTDAVFAKHLVEDCNAAEYVNDDPIEKPEDEKPNKLSKKVKS